MAIDKLLVANRGEIARRVFRTAKDLGIATVAVFSDADADAPFVAEADMAVAIGPGPAASSYLDIDRILEAARRTGADAVHPGYGFLSENAAFARRCAEVGIVFVGPPPDAIAAMGDKVVAKAKMMQARVPVVPGFNPPASETIDDARLVAEAERIGVPLLVKASAGGGGRGMRRVTDLAELPAAIDSARSEAQAAFGDGRLFLERLITGARHIEIQIVADQHGHVAVFGERECSVQRRHQKVIEEAPSIAVGAELRARMCDAATAAARAIDYVGAGTVEFLLDDAGEFYFLEMNTRLQVEHPVTELVTGHDLVRLQILAAEGKSLAEVQTRIEGHAIEARVYAEDPSAGFAPQLGRIALWRPASGQHVRVDSGVQTGQTITAFYDPMIAKVVAWGRDREEARRRLVAAVRDNVLLGPGTNRGFLVALLSDDAFVEGSFFTDTLDAREDLLPASQPSAVLWAVAALLRAPEPSRTPWHSTGDVQWTVDLRCGDAQKTLPIAYDGDGLRVTLGQTAIPVRIVSTSDTTVVSEVDGVRRRFVWARVDDDTVAIDEEGHAFCFTEPRPTGAHEQQAGGDEVRTPMGGRVVKVLVEAGASVEAGQTVAIVEAMKMEHRVTAPRAGVVADVAAAPDAQVEPRQVLATLEPQTTEPSTEEDQT